VFEVLKTYKEKGAFDFKTDQMLRKECNAPKDKSGIYIVYAPEKTEGKPIYIGSSGKMKNDGIIKHRNGGMYDRIVNGKQFNESRKLSWPQKMKEQQIDKLSIAWYVTFNNDNKHIPSYVEAVLLQQYFDEYKRLPDWNDEI
jgi:hypothetical protein